METQQKKLISAELGKLAKKLSQNKLAVKTGLSSATINHMINGKHELIKDELFRKVQVALKIDLNWIHADTQNYLGFMQLLSAAKQKSLSIAIAMKEGRSKSHSYTRFERLNDNVIYVECKNYWTKKTYVQALLRAAGLRSDGTVGELIEAFITHVQQLDSPLIIIDQADKLKDPQLDLFMDFYNDLEDHCAFVLSGVPALQKRILRGVQNDKIGYRELFSRVGRTFVTLPEASQADIAAICNANGITDEDTQIEFFNLCEGDMRRVRRLIERYHLAKQVA